MTPGSKAKRVRIYLNEGDMVGRKPAHLAIVEFLLKEGAHGATVFRATEGFGSGEAIHSDRVLEVVLPHQPLVVEWVDAPDRVDRLIEALKVMVNRGLITVDETHVVLFTPHGVRQVSPRLKAEDVMSRDVASVAPATPVRDVVELMVGKIYRALPVVENAVPVGIITNADLLARAGLTARLELLTSLDESERALVLHPLGSRGETAKDVMSSSPVTVRADAPLTEVADIMSRRRLTRLPVVARDGHLVGMVSRLDLLRTVADGFGEAGGEPIQSEIGLDGDVRVSEVMRREVPAVHPETPIGEVLQAVVSTRLNRALVVDAERRVLGVVTDEELLERATPSLRPGVLASLIHRLPFVHLQPEEAARQHHAAASTAKDLMQSAVPIVLQSAPLREVITRMLHGAEKIVAVVDAEQRLVGVVDRADVLRGLSRSIRSAG
jgi:CBS domain-containing protein